MYDIPGKASSGGRLRGGGGRVECRSGVGSPAWRRGTRMPAWPVGSVNARVDLHPAAPRKRAPHQGPRVTGARRLAGGAARRSAAMSGLPAGRRRLVGGAVRTGWRRGRGTGGICSGWRASSCWRARCDWRTSRSCAAARTSRTRPWDAAYHDQWAEAIAQGEPFVDGALFSSAVLPRTAGDDLQCCRSQLRGAAAAAGAARDAELRHTVCYRPAGFHAGGGGGSGAGDGRLLGAHLLRWRVADSDAHRFLGFVAHAQFALGAARAGRWAVCRRGRVARPFRHRPAERLAVRAGDRGVAAVDTAANGLAEPAVGGGGDGGVLLVVVLPITIRNCAVGGDAVLIASQGGVNFYIGNNPDSDGRTAIVPGTPGDWWGGTTQPSPGRSKPPAGR